MDTELRKKYELKPEQLSYQCDSKEFNFKTTKEIGLGLETIIIGQEKKVEHLKKGLGMPNRRHNIFVTGPEDEEREELIKAVIEDYIKKMPEEDYRKKVSGVKEFVAVYNFSDPNHPMILEFHARKGEKFEKDLNETTEYILKGGIKKYEQDIKNGKIVLAGDKDIQKRADDLASKGAKLSKEANAAEQEAKKLLQESSKLQPDDPKRKKNEDNIMKLKEKVAGLDQQLAQMQNEYNNIVAEGQKGAEEKCKDIYINSVVRPVMGKLIVEYGSNNPKVVKYLQDLEKVILEDVEAELKTVFENKANAGRQVSILGLGSFAMPAHQNGAKDFSQYKVKLLNKLELGEVVRGIPVIFDKDPTVNGLFGTIPLQESYAISPFGTGSAKKDQHLNLKPGSFIKSIGGYLILETMSAISSLLELVKQLDLGETKIENIPYHHILDKSSEKIDCSNVKVILSGKNDLYQSLLAYSDNGVLKFERTFGHKAETDTLTDNTKQAREQYAKRVAQVCKKERLKDITSEGLAEVIEYSTRLAGSKNKLMTLKLLPIENIIREANVKAKDSETITAEHVKKAIEDKRNRHSLMKKNMHEHITDGVKIIDTEGLLVGEINALVAYVLSDTCFGEPAKLTVSTSKGDKGVISLDVEAGNSGESFEKAVSTAIKNMERLFAQDKKISLNGGISLEQSYGKIDGDSATLATFLALMSELGNYPIDQEIAVTGSMNLKGKVQPVGGVNEKIEGFYSICKERGLTGSQGVVIPKRNEKMLMLNDEVVGSVRKGEFHIYSVSTPEEAMEIVTGKSACEYDRDGNRIYSEGTVYNRVNEKIKSYNNTPKKK